MINRPGASANRSPGFSAFGGSVLLVCLLWSAGAWAHRLHAAITTILFNERTQRIEIMHRYFSHDAEHLLRELYGSADIVDSESDQLRFGGYIHERFSLFGDDDQVLPLALIGVELDGDFLWVYQSAPLPQPPLSRLSVEHNALRELWEAQTNTVNVETADKIQTLTFSRDQKTRQSVNLRRSD